jgi:5'-methylthioadenosine phosphorylase
VTGHADVGIIGGSGLYEMEGLSEERDLTLETPFGAPSEIVRTGTLEGRRVAFLARHARGHRILPGELNFRANIFALKMLGVERILSVSAVGSLKEPYAPLQMVVPDQLVDRTRQRSSSFFGRGLVAHVAFDRPYCSSLSSVLSLACDEAGAVHHAGGTYVCIEGPQFSTRAESELYRSWGMDVVGMTNVPEAKLAREAEICYATLAMVTDYDCWHPGHESVTADQVIANLGRNAETAKAILRAALRRLDGPRDCACGRALEFALVTPPHLVPENVKRELEPIIGRYMR